MEAVAAKLNDNISSLAQCKDLPQGASWNKWWRVKGDDGKFVGWGIDTNRGSPTTLRECKTGTCGKTPFDIVNFQHQGTGTLPVSEYSYLVSTRGHKVFKNGNAIGLRYYEQAFCFAEAGFPNSPSIIPGATPDKCALSGKLGIGGLVFRCRAATWTKCLAGKGKGKKRSRCRTKGVGKCLVPFGLDTSPSGKWIPNEGPAQLVHRPGCASGSVAKEAYSITTPDTCGPNGYVEVPCDENALRCHMEKGAFGPKFRAAFAAGKMPGSAGPAMKQIVDNAANLAQAMTAHCEVLTKVSG